MREKGGGRMKEKEASKTEIVPHCCVVQRRKRGCKPYLQRKENELQKTD